MPHKQKPRCERCLKDPVYIEYHDKERGTPIHDDTKLFDASTRMYEVSRKERQSRITAKHSKTFPQALNSAIGGAKIWVKEALSLEGRLFAMPLCKQ